MPEPEKEDVVGEARRVLKDTSRIHALSDSDSKKDEDVSWLIEALADECERLRESLKQIQHRCLCCVTNKECAQAVIDIDGITRKALKNEIRGYKVGGSDDKP